METDQHERLYQQAWSSIQALFSDSSVEPEDTRESLNSLISEIEMLVESLGEG